jgi:UDP-N-acetylglucosamine 1-carboxyvinyltransferase
VSTYRIEGGRRLGGKVRISGNKNAALPCLAACLLTPEPVILSNVPMIEDVRSMIALLEQAGSSVSFLEDGRIKVESVSLERSFTPSRSLCQALRGSILLAGPYCALGCSLTLYPPGGDVIGVRRLDSHFSALTSLGCVCSLTAEGMLLFDGSSHAGGGFICLEEASVTATENTIMACVKSKGQTRVFNAACEPHVRDLCNMLNSMGARISGIGSNLLVIDGVESLKGCEFTLGPDYMEAGSFIGLAACTSSRIVLENFDIKDYWMIARGFEKLGVRLEQTDEGLLVPENQDLKIMKDLDKRTSKIDDAPWPGFPADLMSIMAVVATQAHGSILIHEKMFESRLFYVDALVRMGADIILCDPHRALVVGPARLCGGNLDSPDVRAGMALIIAALCAKGPSLIQNCFQIERGYENLVVKLQSLGASIIVC